MSPFMVKVLLWAVIILVACYAANIDPAHVISAFFQALQQMHHANAGR